MNRTRWSTAALAAGLVVGGCLAGAPAVAAGDGPLAPFHHQRIAWHGCQRGPQDTDGQALDEAGAQCADVTVPLDYARPGRRTITVALSRLRATDTAHRIGAMVINLGGPGIPVLPIVPLARAAAGQTGARFDLIGLDQRFTGRSSPLDCDWPESWISRSAGADRRSFDRAVARSRDLARRCAQRHGDLLPYASTANAARDMDVVRAALGGQLSTVDAVYRAAARHPLRVGRYLVDETVVPALVLDPLTDDSPASAAALADTVRVLATAAAGGTVEPTPEMAATLAGTLTGSGSALHSAQTAIMCVDGAVPRDPEFYWRDIQRHRTEAPLFGPLDRNITPCAFWPTGPVEPQIRVHNAVPALVVNAAGDIGATIEMGRAMHAALTGSRMITLDGVRTHGVYLFRGNGCVDDSVNAYLNTGVLPGGDLTCD